MAIHPDPRFPLLPRDQADVIRIYIELKRAQDRSGRESEMLVNNPLGTRYDSSAGHSPDGTHDLE